MRFRWSWFVLVLSLALNVCFLAGYVHTGRVVKRLQTHEGRAEWAARRLGLDEHQREEFMRLTAEWRAQMRDLQEARVADADLIWADLMGQATDPRKLQEAQARAAEAQRTGASLGTAYLVRMMRLLTPEQRQILAVMIRNRNRF